MWPMFSPITRRSLKGKVRICNQLKNEKDELIVWWYGGIVKNYRAETVPKVVVFFRMLDENDKPDKFVRREIALTFLGLLRIGSIWKEGICRSEAVMPDIYNPNVDFTAGTWKFVAPWQSARNGEENPINQNDYPLHFPCDKNWLLDFPLENGKNLLIPCLEFFVRCYGRSAEVPRVLVTYPWGKVVRRFYVPFDQPVMPNTWPVKLASRIYNGDIVCLAHIYHDPYAKHAAKYINSQVETSFGNGEPFAFIKVSPWFQGKAQILASGLWINDGKTFLSLRLLGCSDPQEAPILRDRQNSNKTVGSAEGDEAGKAWNGAPPHVLNKLSDIVDLTDDEEPDHGSAIIEIEEPDFTVLGKSRVVIDVKRTRTTTAGKPSDGENPSAFSSGEAHSSGKGVGYASIHARPVMESNGMLRDMWNALLYLKMKYPDKIHSVEWFTFEDGFMENDEPHLVGLEAFEDTDEVESDIRNWLFFDTKTQTPRGILIARVTIKDKQVYLAELQRRPRIKTEEDGKKKPAEESFKGLIFILNKPEEFIEWLKFIRSQIRNIKGIVDRVVSKCTGIAATFSHRSAGYEEVPCEAAVLNALSKIGVAL